MLGHMREERKGERFAASFIFHCMIPPVSNRHEAHFRVRIYPMTVTHPFASRNHKKSNTTRKDGLAWSAMLFWFFYGAREETPAL